MLQAKPSNDGEEFWHRLNLNGISHVSLRARPHESRHVLKPPTFLPEFVWTEP